MQFLTAEHKRETKMSSVKQEPFRRREGRFTRISEIEKDVKCETNKLFILSFTELSFLTEDCVRLTPEFVYCNLIYYHQWSLTRTQTSFLQVETSPSLPSGILLVSYFHLRLALPKYFPTFVILQPSHILLFSYKLLRSS